MLAASIALSAATVSAAVAAPAAPVSIPPPVTLESERGAQLDRPDPSSPRRALPINPTLPTGKWAALGPAPIGPSFAGGGGGMGVAAGRITGVAVIPFGLHGGRVIAATAGGGIWTSDNEGKEWTPRTDSAEDLAMGSVTLDASDPKLQIAGTGEANQSGDSYPGVGVLVSSDYGATWTPSNPSGVFTGLDIGAVAIDPNNKSHWFAAASDPAKEGRGGLYVTGDGGKTWAKPSDSSYAPFDGNINSLALNATKPVTVYIGGGPGLVGKSSDGGVTWTAASSGIAAPNSSFRSSISISLAKTNPKVLYASVGSEIEAAALYRTTNGGGSWSKVTTVPDYTGSLYAYGCGVKEFEQGWYDNVVAVDPFDANRIMVGGIAMLTSADGGNSWVNINESVANPSGKIFCGPSIIHADQHAVTFSGTGNPWIGNDGGVTLYQTNPFEGVKNENGNLNITQLYHGFNVVNGEILTGSQDNASAQVFQSGAPALPLAWTGIFEGDGGASWITPTEPELRFIEADAELLQTNTAFALSPRRITPSTGALFVPPLLVVDNNKEPNEPTVFYGGEGVWRTKHPSAPPSQFEWEEMTKREVKVSALAASKDGSVVYAGFTDGVIEVSTDGGATFEPIASEPFTEHFVTGLSVSPSNSKEVVASFSFNDTRKRLAFPHVAVYSYSTTPGSGTWSVITGNLPAFAVSHVVYYDGILAAATDQGVYGTVEAKGSATEWSRLGTGLPNVQVQDLAAGSDGLYAVTHGRGAWKLPSPIKLPINVCGPPCFIPILGKGYPPNEPVRIIFDGSILAKVTSSTNGSFSARVQIPAGALPGSHELAALDEHGVGGITTFLARTDWLSARGDPGQTGFNSHENALSAGNVGALHQAAAPQWGAFAHSAPIYAAGDVYVASDDGTVRSLHPADGRQRWSFAGEGAFDGSPAAVPADPSSPANRGCAVIAGSTGGLVYGLDPKSGGELWSFNAGAAVSTSPVVFAGPASGGRVVYRAVVAGADGSVHALDACSGAPVWSTPGAGAGPVQTPAVLSGVRLPSGGTHTIVVASLGDGVVHAFDAATGGALWTWHAPAAPLGAPTAFTASGVGARVAVASGTVVQELSASTGTPLWSTDTHATVDGLSVALAAGASAPGTVFALNEAGEALALAARTGAVLWSAPAGPGGPAKYSAPSVANGVVYLVSAPLPGAPGTLRALAASDGRPLFSAALGGTSASPPSAGPAVADGRVLVGDFSGGMRIFTP